MTSDLTQVSISFSPSTRTAFIRHLSENPNNRHISQVERDNIVEWLTNPLQRPSTQKSSADGTAFGELLNGIITSSFCWLWERPISRSRVVVTGDRIVDLVDLIHQQNSLAGWDATWGTLSSSFYGAVRSGLIFLIFLLKRCQISPSKRPKGSVTPTVSS